MTTAIISDDFNGSPPLLHLLLPHPLGLGRPPGLPLHAVLSSYAPERAPHAGLTAQWRLRGGAEGQGDAQAAGTDEDTRAG